jgi:hypothetical protein
VDPCFAIIEEEVLTFFFNLLIHGSHYP